ncbi:MAG TPA: sodium:solute symporter [Ktedonobacteraceae bacterium]|jgi:SSS family solute:Na+ symporter|nr:sodium:solute symporter [Ktedonobacteraceae bacterium]
MNWEAFIVFLIFFILVTVLGFVAARWRRGDLNQINEWGLAGRRFGTLITWFLLGGDLYTAYTFIAVPAAMYGLGAVSGFFAVPYTILVYPLIFVLMPRFWAVCKQHGYVTAADFVKGRFGSRSLALAVAFTGIIATMPYIALQMFGIQVSLAALGIPINFLIFGIQVDIPLLIAFIVLAAYTYTSGLRAPAMIAIVKDIMIFVVLIVTLVYLPIRFGGFGHIFAAVHQKATTTKTFFDLVPPKQYAAYVTLSLGSALALFLYPHSLTGTLSSSSARVVKRNTALLPIYSLMLGLLALLGYIAVAAHVKLIPGFGNNSAIPALINQMFPSWFAGFAFAAISIGALVPAAVMSIAAANLFTRNIYKEYFNREATDRQESSVAKITSLVVKFGALLFIVYIPTQYVLNFQLLGGVWILQTLPAVFLGLFTRWFNRWAMLIGWAAGMIAGTGMFIATGLKSSIYPITIGNVTIPMYEAVSGVILNLVLVLILTPIFEAIGLKRGQDQTVTDDYDEETAPVEPVEVGREALG